jgi:hypothetical protein
MVQSTIGTLNDRRAPEASCPTHVLILRNIDGNEIGWYGRAKWPITADPPCNSIANTRIYRQPVVDHYHRPAPCGDVVPEIDRLRARMAQPTRRPTQPLFIPASIGASVASLRCISSAEAARSKRICPALRNTSSFSTYHAPEFVCAGQPHQACPLATSGRHSAGANYGPPATPARPRCVLQTGQLPRQPQKGVAPQLVSN